MGTGAATTVADAPPTSMVIYRFPVAWRRGSGVYRIRYSTHQRRPLVRRIYRDARRVSGKNAAAARDYVIVMCAIWDQEDSCRG